MPDNTHMSIGDVLGQLQSDFPDVTISKIRFLESQGLVTPERTASGYRKFYEDDVQRLRWILRQQRENFLPLKVIKERLIEGGLTSGPWSEPRIAEIVVAPQNSPSSKGEWPHDEFLQVQTVTSPAEQDQVGPDDLNAQWPGAQSSANALSFLGESAPNQQTATSEESSSSDTARVNDLGRVAEAVVEWESSARRNVNDERKDELEQQASASSDQVQLFTRRELATKTGLSEKEIDALVQYGLIDSVLVEGTPSYGSHAKRVADIAARFADYGLEARHLRAYRNSVDREVNLFSQVVTTLLRQRSKHSKLAAMEALEQLTRAGAELHACLLGQEIEELQRG